MRLDWKEVRMFHHLGAVNSSARPPAAHAVRDLPLSKTPEGAIVPHNE
jgi:hypothetical protein